MTIDRMEHPDASAYELAPGQAESATSPFGERLRDDQRRFADLVEASEARSKAARDEIELDPADAVRQPPPSLAERLAAEMLITLKRSPTDWAPRTVTIGSAGVVQLCGRRPFRETVVIFNGSASIQLTANQVDQLSDVGSRQMPLAANATVSLDTEGPVYAVGAEGTTVNIVETYWEQEKLHDALVTLQKVLAEGKVREQV